MQNTLESLVEQNFPRGHYEIIVADNDSTDKTLGVAKEYKENYPDLVSYVIEDKIQSSYAVRNKGINNTKGSILAFTDAECIPAKDWLNNGFSSMEESRGSMLAGRIEFTYKNSEPNIWEYYDSAGKLKQRSYVENAGFGATANLFVRKTMFHKYGKFLEELQSGGDYEFGRRLTKSGEFLIYCERAVVYHPARSTFRAKYNKSIRIAKGQKILERMNLLEHGKRSFKQLIPVKSYPSLPDVKINLIKKLKLILISNIFRYLNYLIRL